MCEALIFHILAIEYYNMLDYEANKTNEQLA